MTLVRSRSAVGDSSCTQSSCRVSDQHVGTNFSQNSRPYIVFKPPGDPHSHASSPNGILVFHWLWFIPTHFYVLGSRPRIACFPVVCWFYLRPDVSVNYSYRVHCRSRQYITPVREPWRMRSTSSLPLLPGRLAPGVVLPDRIPSMGQVELFNNLINLKPLELLLNKTISIT